MATAAIGVNEAISGSTGVNYVREWTGMSETDYNTLYLGLNIASTVCTVVGSLAKNFKCFMAGTLVACLDKDGNEIYKPIEEIEIGDMVLSYDEETGKQCYKPVLQLFRNEAKDWTGVTVNGTEIVSTPGHKYFLPETKEWRAAEELKIGIKVLLSNGGYGIITNVRSIHHEKPQTTYNFEVADVHTYYVGNGVLVHNMNGQPCGGDFYRGGDDMTLKQGEYTIKDGLVVPGKDGVSVNLNPNEVARFGTPHKIVSIPDGLTIAQKGLNPAHYVIRPKYAMTLNQYQTLLYQVKLVPLN